jgi:hypothetical protein
MAERRARRGGRWRAKRSDRARSARRPGGGWTLIQSHVANTTTDPTPAGSVSLGSARYLASNLAHLLADHAALEYVYSSGDERDPNVTMRGAR